MNDETKNAIEICRAIRRHLAMRRAGAVSQGASDFVVQEIGEQHDALSHVLGKLERYEEMMAEAKQIEFPDEYQIWQNSDGIWCYRQDKYPSALDAFAALKQETK